MLGCSAYLRRFSQKYAYLYYSDWRKIEAGTHPITAKARKWAIAKGLKEKALPLKYWMPGEPQRVQSSGPIRCHMSFAPALLQLVTPLISANEATMCVLRNKEDFYAKEKDKLSLPEDGSDDTAALTTTRRSIGIKRAYLPTPGRKEGLGLYQEAQTAGSEETARNRS
jgi:hypothetical protein